MKREEKEKILDLLQDISYAHDEDDDRFWEKWSAIHKYVSGLTADDPPGTLVTEIEWDTDGEEADLPTETSVPEDVGLDGIADYLSDRFGFCVYGFRIDRTSVGSRGIRIQTPVGPVEARVIPDGEYPGIALLYAGEGSGEPGAVMEYTPSGKNAGHIQLRIYSKEAPDDEPWRILRMS